MSSLLCVHQRLPVFLTDGILLAFSAFHGFLVQSERDGTRTRQTSRSGENADAWREVSALFQDWNFSKVFGLKWSYMINKDLLGFQPKERSVSFMKKSSTAN